jgi:MFS family permease
MVYDQVIPLYCILPISRNGLELDNKDIGIIFGISGISAIIVQIVLCPFIVNSLGSVNAFKLALFVCIPAFIFTPELNRLNYKDNIVLQSFFWVSMGVCQLIKTFGFELSYTAIMVIVNNSVSSKNRGKLNGLSQSFVALMRLLSPIFGNSLFAFSTKYQYTLGFPFDLHFIFYIQTILHVIVFLFCLILPQSLNAPME